MNVSEHPDSINFPSSNKKPIKLYPWSTLSTLNRRKYLIKGLLERGSLSVVYGESNSGKTFFALDMAAHISLGWRWRNKNTRRGKVVYVGAESGLGIADRLEAIYLHHELETYGDIDLIIRSVSLLGEENDCDELIGILNQSGSVELIVIDTLARAMGGGNENSSEDMGAIIRNCDKIRDGTGAHVMLIHHSGKDSSKGARGHSSLRAAIDTEIQVSQDNGIITALVVKQRDGKTGEQFAYQLQQVEVGTDEDGEPITSCALTPCEVAPKVKKLSGQKRRALDILYNCIIDKGQTRLIRKDMPQVLCVALSEYRDYLIRERLSSSDKPDSVSKAITRAIDELNNSGITCSFGDHIWIVDKMDKSRQK